MLLANPRIYRALATVFVVAVTVLVLGCQDDDRSPPVELLKWPADYPAGGDSIALIAVSIDAQFLGAMAVMLNPDSAPNHVRNFKWLANNHFYDRLRFHRVIQNFVVQGGDPTGTGSGGAPWTVDAEFNGTPHVRGILSMARNSDPNSASSQFFIVHGDSFPHLDGQYTAFGRLISGFDVLDSIANVPTTGPEHSSPISQVVMDSVRIIPIMHSPS